MPDWQNVPSDDFDYKTWLRYANSYEAMQELYDYNDGTAEECGYDFDELTNDEIETLWDYGTL